MPPHPDREQKTAELEQHAERLKEQAGLKTREHKQRGEEMKELARLKTREHKQRGEELKEARMSRNAASAPRCDEKSSPSSS